MKGWICFVSSFLTSRIKILFSFFSWQEESKFLFNQVRLPPVETTVQPVLAEAMEVEVFSRSNEREACGWWTAAIKVSFLKLDFFGFNGFYD